MLTFAQYLYDAVSKVAPIDGVAVGTKTQKDTWRIDFSILATEEERINAQKTLDAISVTGAMAAVDTAKQIDSLELSVTPRRMREAALGIDNGWLASVNTQIDTLRKQRG